MVKKEKLWNSFFLDQNKGRFTRALDTLRELGRAESHNPQIYLKMGDLYQKIRDNEAAVSSYFKAAGMLEKKGFDNKATALYKMILRINPGNNIAVDKLGKTFKKLITSKISCYKTDDIYFCEKAPPLEKFSLFESLSKAELDELEAKSEKHFFPKDSMIIKEGDSGNSLYIVLKGTLKVIIHVMDKIVELAILSEGGIFGEIAFLTGRPRSASVIATTDAEVMEVKRDILQELIRKDARINNILNGFYESRVQETSRKIMV